VSNGPSIQRLKGSLRVIGVALLAGVWSEVSMAQESVPVAEPQSARVAPVVEPAMDPAIRALLVGLAASLLSEAAASPDPMVALGDSLERKLLLALRSPEFSELINGLIGQAAEEAPAELREPIALFAIATLNSLRREMLEDGGSRRRR